MARLIRANSETPNVANNDDFRLFRYATGGYNGVVENYGNECSYTVTGSDFKINSGIIVYHGVDTEILTAGDTITVDNISGTQYYSVYLEIDLSDSADQTATIKSRYGTSTYPVISAGDDLTTVPTGVANFELYRFEASSGVISNVVAQFEIVEVGNCKNAENAENADLATNATNAIINSDNSYSGFTQDANDVLKVGDYTIYKKKNLLSSPVNIAIVGATATLLEDPTGFDLEIVYGIMGAEMKVVRTNGNLTSWSFGFTDTTVDLNGVFWQTLLAIKITRSGTTLTTTAFDAIKFENLSFSSIANWGSGFFIKEINKIIK